MAPIQAEDRQKPHPLHLAEWRRAIAELYGQVRQRAASDPAGAWRHWRTVRDALLRSHPQTPLSPDQQAQFAGLPYFDYNPDLRVMGEVEAISGPVRTVSLPEGPLTLQPVGLAHFCLASQAHCLTLFWLGGYGGGLFLPFQDATGGQATYGGGRYLYDTIKGADLGICAETIPLDFNFAYNPSCAYNDSWLCPLAPPQNRLPVEIPAGEKQFPQDLSE